MSIANIHLPQTPSKTSQYLWLVPAFLILSITYLYPLSFDNATYQTMAWEFVNKGRLPYVGSWDQNFPGIVYLHSLSIILFGNGSIGFHTLDILSQLAFIVVLQRLTARYLGHRPAVIAALLYAGSYVLYGIGMFGQRDVFAGGLLLVALSLSLKVRDGSKRPALAILAGSCLGAAMLIRPTNILCAVAFAWLLMGAERRTRQMLSFALGACLVIIAGLSPYLFDSHHFHEFYTATVSFNRDLYGASALRVPLSEPHSKNFELALVLLLGQSIVLVRYWRSKMTEHARYLKLAVPALALAIVIECIVLWMGKYFGYHYWPILCLMFPFVAYWLDRLATLPSNVRSRRMIYALYCLVLIAVVFIRSPLRVLATRSGSLAERMYAVNEEYSLYQYNSYPTKLAVIDYIKRKVGPEEEIECCSVDNELVWMSERGQHSRFTMIHPLGMRQQNGKYTSYQLQWRQEFVDGIKADPPKLLMLNSEPKRFFNYLDQDPQTILRAIPGFEQALALNFTPDTTIGTWSMYLRK